MPLPSPRSIGLLVTTIISFASGTAAAEESLCPPDDKIWYEAETGDEDLRIAICSRPAADDEVGRIAVYVGKKGSSGSQRTLLAEADGKDQAKTFVLRRYTRPQTTYLKFEFISKDGRRVAIYDDFADGEPDTRVALSQSADASEPAAAAHVAPLRAAVDHGPQTGRLRSALRRIARARLQANFDDLEGDVYTDGWCIDP